MTQPPVTPSDDAEQSLALLTATTKGIVDNSQRLGLTWNLARATVKDVTPQGEVYGTYDGDTAAIRMTNIHETSLKTGQRIYVLQVPPSGNFIIGPGGVNPNIEPGAGVWVWNGQGYVLSTKARLFVGPVNPELFFQNIEPLGSIWFVTAS